MSERAEQAAALGLTAMAAVLHLLRLEYAGALWRDEAGAVQLAAMRLREIWALFLQDAFPLLFTGTLRAYTGLFGDSDTAFRLLGLAVGLAILVALWWNARLAGALPLVSIVLVQFHPVMPTYGDSIRGYGLGTLAILLTFGAFARLVGRPDRKAILLATLAAVASVHLLLHNAALLAGIGAAAAIVGLLRRRFRVAVAALGVGLTAALSLLVYAGPLNAARDWRVVVIVPITLQRVLGKLREVLGIPFPWLVWVWGGAVALAAGITLWKALKKDQLPPLPVGEVGRADAPTTPTLTEPNLADDARLFRLLVIPAALGGEIAFLIAVGYVPRPWYLLPVLALMASALDGLLAAGGPAPVRVARIAAAALLAAALYTIAVHSAKVRMTNVDLVAQSIDQRAGPRDLVLVNEYYFGVSFHRYYRGDTRWMTVPPLTDHRIHRFDLLKAQLGSEDPLGEVRRAMRRTLYSGHRVWVVGNLHLPPEGHPTPWLPPAPHSPLGWRDGPYTYAWTQQIGVFLKTHAVQERRLLVTDGRPVSGLEWVRIWIYQGWKASPPGTPD